MAAILLPLASSSAPSIYDDFKQMDRSVWRYANHELHTFGSARTYYLDNHSAFSSSGLKVTMSEHPCSDNPDKLCSGADMASDHLQTVDKHHYGDYEVSLRAPHHEDTAECDDDIYAYFTAGYAKEDGWWNEMNFGFHPDRDHGGRIVTAELHADTGGYHEAAVSLGFNYRAGFHTYRLKLRKGDVSWWVDGRCVHVMKEQLSHSMHTSIILRTNKPGKLQKAKLEVKYFRFKPYESEGQRPEARMPPPNATLGELIAWHNANPDWASSQEGESPA